MAGELDHHFDRRSSDVNVAALSVRVAGLEGRMETVEREMKVNSRELAANTMLTRQVHAMAERVEKNTEDIVAAVKWISTTKRVGLALVAGFGAIAGTVVAVHAAGKALGWWA